MVFDGMILSLIVGFFRKGNLKGLSSLNLKAGWIFPLLLGIEILMFLFQNRFSFLGRASGFIYMLVYIAGLLFLFMNRKQTGFMWILIGVFLNFFVMVLNGGRMPVSEHAASILDPSYFEALKGSLYAKHQALTESTKLGFLGDIIPLTKPYPRTQVISIGDIIMNIGIFLFIQHLMVPMQRDKKVKISKSI
ncbi:DUF5317 domain-containing protein [Neobacillus sp. SM06]|uniref:DUF5317 domain-containing protein n=1 Tax=Neobacillus sp. SM06 TaxID=3422492 RepID=UPI003D2A2A49